MREFTAICYNNHDTILIEGETYILVKHDTAPKTWCVWVEFTDEESFLLTFNEEELGDYFFNF